MTNTNAMTMTGRKQMMVGDVVGAFGMRKRKFLNKWRNENDGKTRKIGAYLFC
jgi:hypothetical protein